MVRNFRGQVKIADVQAEFDALIAKINADIEEYNKVINDNEDIDFTHGSPSLSGSGYCLTVGGLKKLLAAYNGTMMGAKPFRNSAGDTLVTAGVLVQSTGCSPTRGQLLNQTGKHLYFDPSSNTFSISDESGVPSVGGYTRINSLSILDPPSSDGKYSLVYYYDGTSHDGSGLRSTTTGGGCNVSINQVGNGISSNSLQYYSEIHFPEYTLAKPYARILEGFPVTMKFSVLLPDISNFESVKEMSSGFYVGLYYAPTMGSAWISGGIEIPIDNIIDATSYESEGNSVIITKQSEGRLLTTTVTGNPRGNYDIHTLQIRAYLNYKSGAGGTNPGDPLGFEVPMTLFGLDISGIYYYGEISPSGVCDMNPNRTYPYLKTIHNTELYNLRTNKIITESRNLTNGSKKSCSKIANDTWTADDNKNESIFVSYNARHSNDGQPNPPVYLNIEGLRSNFNLGTRFTHGSSTSACYRFPKFFFLPKGCRNPFSTTDINTNRIRYNKYKCNITQKK